MITLFWLVFGAGLSALTIAAAVTLRTRRRSRFARTTPVVDDEVIEQILTRGEVHVDEDEPLDLDEIRDEEERFWSETWDEPSGDWEAP